MRYVNIYGTGDTLGRIERITHPDNTYVQYDYLVNNEVRVTSECLKSTTYSYDSFGVPDDKRLVKVKDADNNTTEYKYNAVGSLTRILQPRIPNRVFTYGRPEGDNLHASETNPENGTISYQYCSNGQLNKKTYPKGTTSFGYDSNNRLITIVVIR